MAPSSENKMGRWGATSYFIGSVVGSGIFITPSTILNSTGSSGLAMVVWLLSAAATALGAYCYIELGTSIRQSGGDFAYLSFVKCNSMAFMFMVVGCLLNYPLMVAVQADTFAVYTSQFLGLDGLIGDEGRSAFVLRKLIAFSAVWLLLFLNFFSLRRIIAPFQLITSVAKLLSALLIVLIGFYWITIKGYTENIREPFANSSMDAGKISVAFFAGLFNYEGWDVLNYGVEEVAKPKSNIPFAIFAGMSCIVITYATINISYFIVLSVTEIQESSAVAMSFAKQSMGCFSWLMPLIISLVLINAINATMFTASRYLFAAARKRQLPSFIACINRQHDSPRAAMIVHVFVVFIFSFLGNTDQLIGYLGFAMWLQRGCTMGVMLYIRYRHIPVHPEAIHVPIVLPFLFMAICFSLVIVTIIQDFSTAFVGLCLMAIALIIYASFIWDQALPRFRLFRETSSAINDFCARIAQIALNGQIQICESDLEEEEDVETVGGKGREGTATISKNGIIESAEEERKDRQNGKNVKKRKSNRVWPTEGDEKDNKNSLNKIEQE